MRQVFRCAGLTLALAALTTTFAAGQNQAAKPRTAPPLPEKGEIAGTVAMAGGSSKALVLSIAVQVYEPNKGAKRNTGNSQLQQLYRRQMEIQRDQMQLARARNPRDAMRRMQELQRDMAQLQIQIARLGGNAQQAPFKVVTKKQEYEVATDDNTKVLFTTPPIAFDEKGNVKKYTDAELKELRDPKLPYYKGTFDQLRPGHLVKITLGKPAATSKSKDLDKAPTDDDTPYAALVLVTGEEAPPPPKKKK
jgi:hypothetical protein